MSEFKTSPSVSFEDWVDFCFRKDGAEDLEVARKIDMFSGITLAHYFQRLFEDPMPYLEHRSDEDLGAGLWCLFGSSNGYWWEIRDPSVPAEDQVNAVLTLRSLYRNCFDVLCDNRNEAPARGTNHFNKLDSAVYMLWDMDCLNGAVHCNEVHLVGPIFSVLEEALNCRTVACQISGLHGLGHLQRCDAERVTSLIAPFIQGKKAALPWVEAYANQALTGSVL